MRSWRLGVCLGAGLAFTGGAYGAEGSNPIQGSAGPAAASAPSQTSADLVVQCDRPSSPPMPNRAPISVTVNAATAWQPRGGEVLIAVTGDPTKFTGLNFVACFGWNNVQAANYFSAENLGRVAWSKGFVMNRTSDEAGVLNLGVIVPPLPSAPRSFLGGGAASVRTTGLGIIPVADMRLIAYTKDAVLFDEVRPIGITSLPFALAVSAATMVLAVGILYRLAVVPRPGPAPAPARAANVRRQIGTILSGTWILTLVRAPDGRASLSALQILLWTILVATSAAYVMALSGNLINITPGTLTLLGIAGATGLIANITKPPPVEAPAIPQWRSLILDPATSQPDIGRIQLLFFTVVSAAFVAMQVLNYYVIPDIPAGYQILIGISNGVYVGGKIGGGGLAGGGAPKQD